jgi:hypothetical protein
MLNRNRIYSKSTTSPSIASRAQTVKDPLNAEGDRFDVGGVTPHFQCRRWLFKQLPLKYSGHTSLYIALLLQRMLDQLFVALDSFFQICDADVLMV